MAAQVIAARVRGAVHRVAKAGADEEGDEHEANSAAAAIDYGPLQEAVRPELQHVAKDAAKLGLEQVDADLDKLLSQANERAVAWADERAAEMVTQIDDTTRDGVRALVKQALDEGWSNDELADAIADSDVFDDARAELIARTETAYADVQGNLIGWDESGVVAGKEWIVADANECDDCAALDGEVVGLDEEFPGGDPPLHPNCRCDVLPVLSDDAEE